MTRSKLTREKWQRLELEAERIASVTPKRQLAAELGISETYLTTTLRYLVRLKREDFLKNRRCPSHES